MSRPIREKAEIRYAGLQTKSSSDSFAEFGISKICKNFDFYEQYFAMAKVRGNKRLLSTPHANGWESINQYRAIDLLGGTDRHILCEDSAGNVYSKNFNSDSLTLLKSGLAGRKAFSAMYDRWMLYSDNDAYSKAIINPPWKYDGEEFTRLGVDSPDQKTIVMDPMEGGWVPVPGATVTININPTITLDTGSTELVWTPSGYCAMRRDYSPYLNLQTGSYTDVYGNKAMDFGVWVYISAASFNQGVTLSVRTIFHVSDLLPPSEMNHYVEWSFGPDTIHIGWNFLRCNSRDLNFRWTITEDPGNPPYSTIENSTEFAHQVKRIIISSVWNNPTTAPGPLSLYFDKLEKYASTGTIDYFEEVTTLGQWIDYKSSDDTAHTGFNGAILAPIANEPWRTGNNNTLKAINTAAGRLTEGTQSLKLTFSPPLTGSTVKNNRIVEIHCDSKYNVSPYLSFTQDLSTAVDDILRVDIFIEDIQYLVQKEALKVTLISRVVDTIGYTEKDVHKFDLEKLDEDGNLISPGLKNGWNNLEINLLEPANQSGGGCILNAVERLQFEFFHTKDATTLFSVAPDPDDELPPENPTYYLDNIWWWTSTSEMANKTYSYRVTFLTKHGLESNAGPPSEFYEVGPYATSLILHNIPTSSDPEVTTRYIYRTANGGVEHLFLAAIYDNVTTEYTDTMPDTKLTLSQEPPEAGNINSFDDHGPPPAGVSKFFNWRGTIFGYGDPAAPNVLYWTNPQEPEQWPTINNFKLDARITDLMILQLALIVTTETGVYIVNGENPNYYVDQAEYRSGQVGLRASTNIRYAYFSLDIDHIRFMTNRPPIQMISEPIRDKIHNWPKINFKDSVVCAIKRRNTVCVIPREVDGTTPEIWTYYYILDKFEEGFWTTTEPDSRVNHTIKDMVEIEDNEGNYLCYVAGSDGMLYEYFADDSFSWVDKDGNKYPISSVHQTGFFRPAGGPKLLGSEEDQKGRARIDFIEVRLGGDLSTGSNWEVTIEQVEGSGEETEVISTETKILPFAPNQSLDRWRFSELTPYSFIRLTIKNEELDKNIYLKGMRVYYYNKAGQFINQGYK